VEFAPGTALRGLMLLKQPFARAAQLQPRAIDNQVQFVGSISPVGVNPQTGRSPAQSRMIASVARRSRFWLSRAWRSRAIEVDIAIWTIDLAIIGCSG
jgi:hypothetical protein